MVTPAIEESLLNAAEKGQTQLQNFVEKRLLVDSPLSVRDPLPKNKPLTFSSLFEITWPSSKTTKQKILKADRSILQRLIIALDAGRDVDIGSILSHELLPVPIAIAEMNGGLRSGNKAELTKILTTDIQNLSVLDAQDPVNSALVIDGQALVVGMGKPKDAVTFGDLGEMFASNVCSNGRNFDRIHVLFDRYYVDSIKSGTRKRRGKGLQPVRRVIESPDVPLPSDWKSFLALADNKADYPQFLYEDLMTYPTNSTIVTAGGFEDEETAESNNSNVDTAALKAHHEEADTRIIFHCHSIPADTIVVQARDTDILVLLVSHFQQMQCSHLWLKTGTSKQRQYIPVHDIVKHLELENNTSLVECLPAFHALTGSDVTSFFLGQGKKTAWKVYKRHHGLLKHLGCGDLSNRTQEDAETFVCRLYGLENTSTTNAARQMLFLKLKSPKNLPPSSDAIRFHIHRSHYQASLWRQAADAYPVLPLPESSGWERVGGKLVPQLMSLPSVPTSCVKLIFCSCASACSTMRCGCKKAKLSCTSQCKCSDGIQCANVSRT